MVCKNSKFISCNNAQSLIFINNGAFWSKKWAFWLPFFIFFEKN